MPHEDALPADADDWFSSLTATANALDRCTKLERQRDTYWYRMHLLGEALSSIDWCIRQSATDAEALALVREVLARVMPKAHEWSG